MTLQQFINKWLGKKADFDGFYGGQCVDLYRYYVQDVLEVPQSPGVGGAAEIWHSASEEYFTFIEKESGLVPQPGDIVIWNRNAGGGFGHVSIFLHGDTNRFTSLDQNWPTLNEVTKTEHDYKNIIGWIRPKSLSNGEEQNNMDGASEELLNKILKNAGIGQEKTTVNQLSDLENKIRDHVGDDWNGGYLKSERDKNEKFKELEENGIKNIDDVRAKFAQLEQQVSGRDETIDNLNKTLGDKNGRISVLQSEVSSKDEQLLILNSRVESLTDQAKKVPEITKENTHLKEEKSKWVQIEESYNRSMGQLRKENEELRANVWKVVVRVLFQEFIVKVKSIYPYGKKEK